MDPGHFFKAGARGGHVMGRDTREGMLMKRNTGRRRRGNFVHWERSIGQWIKWWAEHDWTLKEVGHVWTLEMQNKWLAMAPALRGPQLREECQLRRKLNITETVQWFRGQEPGHPSSHNQLCGLETMWLQPNDWRPPNPLHFPCLKNENGKTVLF